MFAFGSHCEIFHYRWFISLYFSYLNVKFEIREKDIYLISSKVFIVILVCLLVVRIAFKIN
ncbi:CcdC protein domain-containing protein [Bacillus cereus]|uniref:CcdC protein domain-containing protein n=1 Tax=Bacillus cereus TaxID=1396 RepID=UPI003D3376E3